MRRLFWVSVGAGAGVWATRRVTRLARQWTPESVAARVAGRARLFAEDVRAGMRARERQLREATELDAAAGAPPRRVLRARYTIIDDDEDGY